MLVGVGESGGMWVYDLVEAYSNNVNGTDGLVSLHMGDDRWGRILARARRPMAGSLTHGRGGIQWGAVSCFCGEFDCEHERYALSDVRRR